MRSALTSLTVDQLIVHEVPKKVSKAYQKKNPEATHEDILYSEVPTEFDEDLIDFFYKKISSTIGSTSAFDIELDLETENNQTQLALTEYFNLGKSDGFPLNDDNVIRITQNISKSLFDVQTARNPGGILLFIPCHNNIQNGIAILKVEREAGVRIRRETTEKGKYTFNAEHIRDLMLTDKTKLFKIVLFYENEEKIVGVVCDQQQGVYNDREVADFFLSDFLGCKLTEAAIVSTKNFYDTVNSFINNCNLTDKEKLDVRTHLISEISNNQTNLSVISFANRCIPRDKFQLFMDLVKEKNITTNFVKDSTLIEEKLAKVRYEFECGLKLSGSEEVMKNKVKVVEASEGKSRFEITDRLKKVE